ncbi:MAG: hypothetical protein AAAFM81_03045, partial [Pseudomonadota bacterium]
MRAMVFGVILALAACKHTPTVCPEPFQNKLVIDSVEAGQLVQEDKRISTSDDDIRLLYTKDM